jgi:hypothetical protein
MTAEVAHRVRMLRWLEGWRVIAVNDVYKLLPYADILYSCDERWWVAHDGAQKFHGERWSSHAVNLSIADDKIACAKRFDLHLVHGTDGEGFSIDQRFINYGGGSGGQAVNLAILKGCRRIVMVGFDGRKVDGRSHFFGEHPAPLANTDDENYKHPVRQYQRAAQLLPDSISIVNATPNSAITAFPMMGLDDACRTAFPRADGRVHCNGAESHARTD